MLRVLAVLLVPPALFAAACGAAASTQPGAVAKPIANATAAPASPPPTPIVLATRSYGVAVTDQQAISDVLDPLALLGDLSRVSPAPLGPELQTQLLAPDDLPVGFTVRQQFSFQVPCPSGTIQMATNMFASGGSAAEIVGPMVMSAVLDLPPAAADDIRAHPGLDSLGLGDLHEGPGEDGVSLLNLHALDASGLGGYAAGMHMEIDLRAASDAIGAELSRNGVAPEGRLIAVDMYTFLRADRVYMASVTYPAGGGAAADAGRLAALLAGRTGAG
jgi:hypothetical protein